MVAVYWKRAEKAKVLIEAGADVHIQDKNGNYIQKNI